MADYLRLLREDIEKWSKGNWVVENDNLLYYLEDLNRRVDGLSPGGSGGTYISVYSQSDSTPLTQYLTSLRFTGNATLTQSGNDITVAISGGAGSGDMSKSTYDTDNDGVVDAAERTTLKVRNNSGGVMYKGTVVYINGAIGQLPTIARAQANSEGASAQTFGVIKDDINDNANGYIVTSGFLDLIDTRNAANGNPNPFISNSVTLAVGNTLYLDPSTAGYVTNVKPSAPNHLVYVGKVVNIGPATTNGGAIVYRIQNGYELDEIHDVKIVSKANGDSIFYNSTSGLWENKSITTALGYTPISAARQITTTSPLSGGGNLSTDLTISVNNAAADGTTKGAATFTASDFNDNGSGVISIDYTNAQKASSSQPGFLTAADWQTFNNKGAGTVNSVNYISPSSGNVLINTGDIKVSEQITVNLGSGVTVGGFTSGDVINTTDTITQVLKKLLIKVVNPTYTQPTLTTPSAVINSVETGVNVSYSANRTFTYTNNDAGGIASSSFVNSRTSSTTNPTLTLSGGVASYNAIDPASGTVTIQAVDGTQTFNYTLNVNYIASPAKLDNTGQPNTVNAFSSGTLTRSFQGYVTGTRYSFYKSFTSDVSASLNSTYIRTNFVPMQASNPNGFNVTMAQGSLCLIFGFPASTNNIFKLEQLKSDGTVYADVTSFLSNGTTPFTSTMLVEGANGYTAVNYKFYKLVAGGAYTTATDFKISII